MGNISFCVSECETRAVMDAPESLGIIKENTFLGQSLGILTQSFSGAGIVLFPNAPVRHYAASSGVAPCLMSLIAPVWRRKRFAAILGETLFPGEPPPEGVSTDLCGCVPFDI